MMKRPTIKKLLASILTATLLSAQTSTAAFAATDAQAGWGAKMGAEYLIAQQLPNGGYPAILGGEADWAAIALAAAGYDPNEVKNGSTSLVDFITADPLNDETDVARRILAAAAIGFDNDTFTGINFGEQLYALYDGTQIGDPGVLSDDMFGIMAAAVLIDNPAQTQKDELAAMARASLSYLLSYQESDGGFSYTTAECPDWCGSSTDMTAAAIIAMQAGAAHGFADPNDADFVSALDKAKNYLLQAQDPEGGFLMAVGSVWPADGLTTSWALMALNTLDPSNETVQTAKNAARSWLLARQNADGGFDGWTCGASDVIITAHAVPALLGTTWLLSPAPITIPDAAPDEMPTHIDCPAPAPTPTEPEEPKPQPINTTTPTPVATTDTSTNTQPESEPQILSATPAEESSEGQPEKTDAEDIKEVIPISEEAKSSIKYVIYAIIALSLIGFGWFLFRPQKG